MIEIFYSNDNSLEKLPSYKNIDGAWLNITKPTTEEIIQISQDFQIDEADLAAALDLEESSRVIIEDNYQLILFDIPSNEPHSKNSYSTFPLGVIITKKAVLTICSAPTPIIQHFIKNTPKDFATKKKIRFIYQLLLRSANAYQQHLLAIDKRRLEVEKHVNDEIKDSDLVKLHDLESTLVYFETSLRANLNVVDRLRRYNSIKQYPEDEELLDDVEIEYKQAIETTTIYRNIIDSTQQLLSAILDKRLNKSMKFLTSITIVMAIPTIISGIYGMNLAAESMPFSRSPFGFSIVCGIIALICLIVLIIMNRKKMF